MKKPLTLLTGLLVLAPVILLVVFSTSRVGQHLSICFTATQILSYVYSILAMNRREFDLAQALHKHYRLQLPLTWTQRGLSHKLDFVLDEHDSILPIPLS